MTDEQQTLLDFYQDLSLEDKHSLLRFAEFLATGTVSSESAVDKPGMDETESPSDQSPVKNDVIPEPEKIERPEDERVVDALKRLSATYPMLEKKTLLNKASELVAQHVMFGKPAVVVINEIEEMFAEAYDKFVEDAGNSK